MAKLTRIKNNSDIFDSEGDSDDDDNKIKENIEKEKSETERTSVDTKRKGVRTKDDKLVGDCIDSLSEMYDDFSFTDSFLTLQNRTSIDSQTQSGFTFHAGSLQPGQLDSFPIEDTLSVDEEEVGRSCGEYVKLGCIRKCRETVDRVAKECGEEGMCAMTVPVEEKQDTLMLQTESALQSRFVYIFLPL